MAWVFTTPEEAALCYARHVWEERAAFAAAEVRGKGPRPLSADEVKEAATAEGLELVPSLTNESGFKGVCKSYGKYAVGVKENGVGIHLGTFATPEEAALCYARRAGAERAAAEAAQARGEGPRPLTADEARAAAATEGLELVPSSSSETGFKCVVNGRGNFRVSFYVNGKQRRLGTFATPEEAALCYARRAGAERAVAEAAQARGEGPRPLTADEARAAAAAEGLELVPSSSNETGFKGVTKHRGKYKAALKCSGKQYHLGMFATPEEAALSYARHIGAERAAAEAAAARAAASLLTADEIWAAAAAEGLELVPACNEAGFKSVVEHYGKYATRVRDDGKLRHLGSFATPEEVALCYARHVGKERAAGSAEARVAVPKPLKADEARAAAAAEGLELVPSSSGETGFRGVFKHNGRYQGQIWENGKRRYVGSFATPEEAALCYARRAGAERSAVEAAEARGEGPQPLTADEARAAAAAEGLELVPSSSNETGFKGVSKNSGKYRAVLKCSGKRYHLGMFPSPEEAALCYARHIGAERSAAEAAEARVERPRPLTADEARAAAAAEGLELVPSSSNETGFKAVCNRSGRYTTETWENGKKRHLGAFATPEEAALCYARHVRDLIDGWLIPGSRPAHRPSPRAPVPAPPTRSEVEQAEALRCWHLLLTAMRDDRRKQQGSPSSSPAATTEHASRKRLAVAVAFAEVVLQGAVTLQPQLTPESGDDPGAARCVICLEALDLSAASSRGEAACGHTPCCGNYYHKRCLSQWLQGSGQSDNDPLPIERLEKKCPTCRREQLVARTLVPGPCPQRLCK